MHSDDYGPLFLISEPSFHHAGLCFVTERYMALKHLLEKKTAVNVEVLIHGKKTHGESQEVP